MKISIEQFEAMLHRMYDDGVYGVEVNERTFPLEPIKDQIGFLDTETGEKHSIYGLSLEDIEITPLGIYCKMQGEMTHMAFLQLANVKKYLDN